jgi:lipoate-protein ligase B
MPVELSAEIRFAVNLPTSREMQDTMLISMRRAVAAVLARAQTNLSGRFLKTRTGRGLASLRTKIKSTATETTGTIGSPVFYLRILHVGFAGGVFTTGDRSRLRRFERAQGMTLATINRGKAFTFAGPGGQIIRTQSINHPGVTARPWLQTALEESTDDILSAFDQAAQSLGRFVVAE